MFQDTWRQIPPCLWILHSPLYYVLECVHSLCQVKTLAWFSWRVEISCISLTLFHTYQVVAWSCLRDPIYVSDFRILICWFSSRHVLIVLSDIELHLPFHVGDGYYHLNPFQLSTIPHAGCYSTLCNKIFCNLYRLSCDRRNLCDSIIFRFSSR